MQPRDPLTRIRSLLASNVRGFPHVDGDITNKRRLDTDGDIVLLVGPNGSGKSSLLEAISLLCTGQSWETHDLQRHSFSAGEPTQILADVVSGHDRRELCRLVCDPREEWQEPARWWAEGGPGSQKRHARLVVYDPLYVREFLRGEGAAPGQDFADFLAPNPVQADMLKAAFNARKEEISRSIRELKAKLSGVSAKELAAGRDRHASAIRAHLAGRSSLESAASLLNGKALQEPGIVLQKLAEIVRGLLDSHAKLSFPGASVADAEPAVWLRYLESAVRLIPEDSELAVESLSRLRDLPPEALPLLIASEENLLSDVEELEKTLAHTRSQLDLLEKIERCLGDREPGNDARIGLLAISRRAVEQGNEWAHLPEMLQEAGVEAEAIATLSGLDLVGLVSQFSSAAASLDTVANLVDTKRKLLAAEVARCETQRALRQATSDLRPNLQKHFGELFETFAGKCESPAHLAEMLSQESRPNAPVGSLSSAFGQWAEFEEEMAVRGTALPDVSKQLEGMERMLKVLQTESGRSASSLLVRLQEAAALPLLAPMETFLNGMASRFRMSQGLSQIHLTFDSNAGRRLLSVEIGKGKERRSISTCSTGQRNQIGFLLFLCLGHALRNQYATRIVCFDDVMASFDMNQLPRLAVMLRQLAYEDHEARRQVFLASHNEDVSAKLIHMLTPPEGRSMRVLRFESYSKEDGPVLKAYRVAPRPLPEENRVEQTLRQMLR